MDIGDGRRHHIDQRIQRKQAAPAPNQIGYPGLTHAHEPGGVGLTPSVGDDAQAVFRAERARYLAAESNNASKSKKP